jgi:hypothetical protein
MLRRSIDERGMWVVMMLVMMVLMENRRELREQERTK